MKKLILLALFAALASLPASAQEAESAARRCDESLWRHVYSPSRLSVVDRCITVTGTIVSAAHEKDGDVHVRVRLDARYRHLLNHFNHSEQGGNLVVEPICVSDPAIKPAKDACGSFRQHIRVPEPGTRVSITGALVVDERVKINGEWTHGWREIHPVTAIRPL